MSYCKDCKTLIPLDDTYCDECRCPTCGGSNEGGPGECDECRSMHCKDCGASIPPGDVRCDDCTCSGCGGSNQGGGLCDECQSIADEIAAEEAGEEAGGW
jgi:hypothetical protein